MAAVKVSVVATIEVELDAVIEIHGVAGVEEALADGLVVGELRGLAEEGMHHVLRALLIEDAPDGGGVDLLHGGEHVLVGEETGSEAVAAVEGGLDGVAVAEEHGGGVEEGDEHAAGAHGIELIVADHGGLDLLLIEDGHDIGDLELALGEADDADVIAGTDAKGGKGELLDVVVLVEAGGFEGGFQLLELGGRTRALRSMAVGEFSMTP